MKRWTKKQIASLVHTELCRSARVLRAATPAGKTSFPMEIDGQLFVVTIKVPANKNKPAALELLNKVYGAEHHEHDSAQEVGEVSPQAAPPPKEGTTPRAATCAHCETELWPSDKRCCACGAKIIEPKPDPVVAPPEEVGVAERLNARFAARTKEVWEEDWAT